MRHDSYEAVSCADTSEMRRRGGGGGGGGGGGFITTDLLLAIIRKMSKHEIYSCLSKLTCKKTSLL